MRTGGQGQAAVPRERVRRRRSVWSAWTAPLGRRRICCGLSQNLWSAIQRPFPDRLLSGRAFGAAMGASAFMAFLFARSRTARVRRNFKG